MTICWIQCRLFALLAWWKKRCSTNRQATHLLVQKPVKLRCK